MHDPKKRLYREPKSFFISRKLYELHSKPFLRTKASLARAFLRCPQKFSIFTNQKPFFRTNLSLLLFKATLFRPPPPLHTALNLLFAKNTAVLLLFALILCCKAGTSHRFKSLPAIPSEVAAFRKTGYLMNGSNFRKNHVSTGDLNRGSQGFAPRAFWLLFARCKK